MDPVFYEVTDSSGKTTTIRTCGGHVGAVPRPTRATRSSWTDNPDGSKTVTTRTGKGRKVATFTVRRSAYGNP